MAGNAEARATEMLRQQPSLRLCLAAPSSHRLLHYQVGRTASKLQTFLSFSESEALKRESELSKTMLARKEKLAQQRLKVQRPPSTQRPEEFET